MATNRVLIVKEHPQQFAILAHYFQSLSLRKKNKFCTNSFSMCNLDLLLKLLRRCKALIFKNLKLYLYIIQIERERERERELHNIKTGKFTTHLPKIQNTKS